MKAYKYSVTFTVGGFFFFFFLHWQVVCMSHIEGNKLYTVYANRFVCVRGWWGDHLRRGCSKMLLHKITWFYSWTYKHNCTSSSSGEEMVTSEGMKTVLESSESADQWLSPPHHSESLSCLSVQLNQIIQSCRFIFQSFVETGSIKKMFWKVSHQPFLVIRNLNTIARFLITKFHWPLTCASVSKGKI